MTQPTCRPRPRHEALIFLLLLVCSGYFLPRAGRSDWNATARADLVFAISHLLGLIPYEKLPRKPVKLPKRLMRHAYDDRATLEGRRFVAMQY